MSNKKDISELFRANEHKLRQNPSPQAWDRLESRLDRRRATGGNTLYRRLAMAAALLVLIAFVGILPAYLGPKSGNQMAANEADSSLFMEEIISADNGEGNARPLSIREVYQDIDLQEGDSDKRLTVAVRNSGPLNQPPANRPTPKRAESAVETPELETAGIADANTPQPALEEEAPQLEELAGAGAAPADYSYDDDVSVAYEKDQAARMSEQEAIPQNSGKSSPPAMANKEIVQMDAATNAISYEGQSLDPGVQQFQWLIGQWKSDEGMGNSFERWEAINAFTIKGQGVLVLNGEETFTEEMQIQLIGQQLYFITAIDSEGQKRYFRLKSYNDGIAVFEDEENAAFPQQVILEQNGPNSFNATFTEEENEDMTPVQQSYLQNRNIVQPDRASRNLSRVGQK